MRKPPHSPAFILSVSVILFFYVEGVASASAIAGHFFVKPGNGHMRAFGIGDADNLPLKQEKDALENAITTMQIKLETTSDIIRLAMESLGKGASH